jgi:cephalosporin hydroxylase
MVMPSLPPSESNPLEAFFDARIEGHGIWKWRHYFEIYHRHLAKFRNQSPIVVEVGIYSGGSLDLWRDYFGPGALLVGVDVEPTCRTYERPGTGVIIGDQGDPQFWRRILSDGSLPAPDIVIDDGSHRPEHQRTTLEELLPRMRPGGVYICEDIHGRGNPFAAFSQGVADGLNAALDATESSDPERRSARPTTPFQSAVHSIHFYPFVTVAELRVAPLSELVAPRHGTLWQPFLS